MKRRFWWPRWSPYVEFLIVLSGLYFLKYVYDGQVGFDSWLVHPSVLLVAIFSARYGLVPGLGICAFALIFFVLAELPAKPLEVSNFDHLAAILVLPALAATAALLFGALHDRSAQRILSLQTELAESQKQNEELRRFANEAVSSLRRNDAHMAFGTTDRAIRIYRALDDIYLTDRAHISHDLSETLAGITPGIEFAFLNERNEIVEKSLDFDPIAIEQRKVESQGKPGKKRKKANARVAKQPKASVRAPFHGQDILPSARMLVLTSRSGVAAQDLEVCLRVICRTLVGTPMVLDLGEEQLNPRSPIA